MNRAMVCAMRQLFLLGCLLVGCAGKVDSTGEPRDEAGVAESGTPTTETGVEPPIDVGPPPPAGCTFTDPLNPPAACGPEGSPPCSATSKVASCPTDNPCMAPVKQSLPTTTHRIGRLRLWKPDALLSLASIAFDPNLNARCANGGTESMSWLLSIDRTTKTLTTGSSHASTDGRTFAYVDETLDPSKLAAVCPGFTAPAPIRIAAAKVPFAVTGSGFAAQIPSLNVANYDSSGVPIVLPLREVSMRVPSMPDPSCIGSWEAKYWCDGDSLGWTTGGSIVAKISAEDADNVPIKSAGCQSLCAILVNDSTKTDGRRCKRGPDGKVPEIGDTCLGGTGCKNAFLLSTSFAAYGVTTSGP